MENAIPEQTESTSGHCGYSWLLKNLLFWPETIHAHWLGREKSPEKQKSYWHLRVSGTCNCFLFPCARAWGRHTVQRHLVFSRGTAPGSALTSMQPSQMFLSLFFPDKDECGHGSLRCAPTCHWQLLGSCSASDVLHQKPLNNVYREFLLILARFKEKPSEFGGYRKFCKEHPQPKQSLQKEIRMAR